MYYRNTIDMSLLPDKLNLKCYVLYETKKLLTITKNYIVIINVLIFIVSIVIVIIIIIIIVIAINFVIISIITLFVKSAWHLC